MFHMQSSDYFHTEKVGRPNPGCSADTYSSAVWLADVAGEDLMRCKLAQQLLVRIVQYAAQ